MAAVAILFATTVGMAKDPKLGTNGTSKSIDFEWDAQLVNASLKIYDLNGNIVYSDFIIKADEYYKRFDLTPLAEGAYFFKIENGTKELVYSINVNKSDISILDKAESLRPAFRKKEGRVYLNYLNRELTHVEVSVTDSSGNTLFEETFKDSFLVEKAFNFNDAFDGDYTIQVKNGAKTFYEMVTVE